MFRTARGPEEPYVDYIKRVTRTVETHCSKYNIKSWIRIQSARKRELGTRIFCDTENKWSERLLGWAPRFRTEAKRSIWGAPSEVEGCAR